mmetsp:Transcript_24369/g.44078  ORF Transcript_24369/g.44078 Transcript_24369/m.44078 type:complete len:88 (+) Transcript_24369:1140-1403(+)
MDCLGFDYLCGSLGVYAVVIVQTKNGYVVFAMPLFELDSLFRGQQQNSDALIIFSRVSTTTVVGFYRRDRVLFYCILPKKTGSVKLE